MSRADLGADLGGARSALFIRAGLTWLTYIPMVWIMAATAVASPSRYRNPQGSVRVGGPRSAQVSLTLINRAFLAKGCGASLGLVWWARPPLRPRSTGGKQKLGPISKQGDRYLRRILVVGAHAVLKLARQKPEKYPWLTQLLARKPFKIVAVAGQQDGTHRLGVAGQGRPRIAVPSPFSLRTIVTYPGEGDSGVRSRRRGWASMPRTRAAGWL